MYELHLAEFVGALHWQPHCLFSQLLNNSPLMHVNTKARVFLTTSLLSFGISFQWEDRSAVSQQCLTSRWLAFDLVG